MREILLSDTFISHNAIRKFAQAIVNILTKEQLKTLKSRLQFDPRKLPLTSDQLITIVQKGDESELNLLHNRYYGFVDAFQKLVEPNQLAEIANYANFVEKQIEQCDNDDLLDNLELLHGHLLNFLDDADSGHSYHNQQTL